MKTLYEIPMIGAVDSSQWTSLHTEDSCPCLRVAGPSFRSRFAMEIGDDGLEGLNIHKGDYLVFVQSGWPTEEETVCLCRQGDEAIVRIMRDLYAIEPELAVTGDRYPDLRLHRNEYVVVGQLVGVIRRDGVDWAPCGPGTYD